MKNNVKKIVGFALALICAFTTLVVGAPVQSSAATTKTVSVTCNKFSPIKAYSGYEMNLDKSAKTKPYSGCKISSWSHDSSCNDQQFEFIKISDGIYEIAPKDKTSLRVNIYSDAPKSGNGITLWSRTGHSSQQWTLTAETYNGTTYVAIRSKYNNKLCLTNNGKGKQLTVTTWSGATKQLWCCSNFSIKTTTTTTKATTTTKSTTNTAKKTISDKTYNYIPFTQGNYSICQRSSMYSKNFQDGGCLAMCYSVGVSCVTKKAMINPQDYWKDGSGAIPNGANVSGYLSFNFNTLVSKVKSGKPVIVHYTHKSTGSQHWILAIGLTSSPSSYSDVLVMDSGDGTICTMQAALNKYKSPSVAGMKTFN